MTSKLVAMYLGELMAGAVMMIIFYYVSLLLAKRKKLYSIITGVVIAFLFFGLFNKNLSFAVGIGIILAGFIIYIKTSKQIATR